MMDRRRFIGTLGTSIASLSVLSNIGSALPTKEDMQVRIRRSGTNPVSLDYIFEKRARALENWDEQLRVQKRKETRSVETFLQYSDSPKIVAYNFDITEGGKVDEFYGTLSESNKNVSIMGSTPQNEERLVSELHTEADNKLDKSTSVNTNDLPGANDPGEDNGKEWRNYDRKYNLDHTHILKPYGAYSWAMSFFTHPKDEHVYAQEVYMSMQAGENRPDWNSDWLNTQAWINQNWNNRNYPYADPRAEILSLYPKNSPSGVISKSVHMDVAYGDAGFGASYGYSQPAVKVVNKSNADELMNVRHKLSINRNSWVASSNGYFNPASIAKVEGLEFREPVNTVQIKPRWFKPGGFFGYGSETHQTKLGITFGKGGYGCKPGSIGEWC